MKYEICEAFENPKKARQYARFSAIAYTMQEAEQIAKSWQESNRYPFVWIEGGK